MISKPIKIFIGFLLLFILYHAAEYFVLFKNNPVGFLLFQFGFFVTAMLIAKWQGYKGLSAWGLSTKKSWIKNLAAGMTMGILLYGSTFGVSIAMHSEKISELPKFSETLPSFGLFCFGTFFSSFSEDILTRGYLFKHFGKKLPSGIFICLSACVYLLNHIYRLEDGLETYGYLFLLGILFVIPLLLTKRLWFTGGMHWMGNTTFYFTHSVINAEAVENTIGANTILIVFILLFIPIVAFVVKILKLQQFSAERSYGGIS